MWKIACYYDFFRQKSIFAYSLCVLSVTVNIAKISKARLHYDVIVMSYEDGWYLFGIKEKRRSIAIIHW